MDATVINTIKQRLYDDTEVIGIGSSAMDMVIYSVEQAIKEHKEKISKKSPRTAWTVENLAEWLAKYDALRLSGTMKAPYDKGTFEILIVESALDKVEGRTYTNENSGLMEHNSIAEKIIQQEGL